MAIYLDHAATTPMVDAAIAAMTAQMAQLGNPSSLHAPGRASRKAIERAGEEKERHDEKVHDELESLHVIKQRSDHRAERGKEQCDKKHEEDRNGDERPTVWAEPKDRHEDEHE